MFVRRAVCEPVRCILLSARRWASSCNHEHDCQGPDDVKYVRGASTKMNPSTILCPQNEALVKALAQYADLQRRRGNIEIAEAYTLPAAGIIDNLRKCCLPIRSADEVKHLRLRFLSGPSKMDLKEKVEEVHLHGNIAELEEDPAITARKLFLNIPGLIHLADDFVLKGYRNLDDLLKSKEAASWTSQQYREVKYFEHLKSRIATQEAVLFEMLLKDHLSEWNRDVVVSETGSVRRRELWARTQDVRFIVTHPSISSGESSAFFKEVVKHVLQTVNGASDWETWLEGAHSVMLKARIPQVFNRTTWRRLTLRWVPFDEWVPQLIDATGHSRFTEKLAGRMADKGWKLTPTAIYNPNNELVVVQSEQELFRLIDEPYIPPWDRTEQGPQLNRRNNEFQFVAGEYKEKPRAHRVRNYKGRRPSYHELLKQREASAPQTNKDFDFRLTHFENGFDRQELQQRLHNDDDPQ